MSEEPPKKLRRLTPKQQEGKPIRILCVEDAVVIRETIARLLKLQGYEVGYANNGREGIEMALKWKPDVVLMDLSMPIMDGYKAITQMKLSPKTHHLPIFVLSAWGGQKERTQAMRAGADEFFVKPPNLDVLVEAIEKYCQPSKT